MEKGNNNNNLAVAIVCSFIHSEKIGNKKTSCMLPNTHCVCEYIRNENPIKSESFSE